MGRARARVKVRVRLRIGVRVRVRVRVGVGDGVGIRVSRRVDSNLAKGLSERNIVKTEVLLPRSHLLEARERLGSVPLGDNGELHELHVGAWQRLRCSHISGGYDPLQLLLGQRCIRVHRIVRIVLLEWRDVLSGMEEANKVRLRVRVRVGVSCPEEVNSFQPTLRRPMCDMLVWRCCKQHKQSVRGGRWGIWQFAISMMMMIIMYLQSSLW